MSQAAPKSRNNLLPVGILLVAAGMFAFQVFDLINFGIDDLFIVLRVGANVLAGFGFVYNRGQFIEGYSDWLWIVLLLPIMSALGGSAPSMAAMWAAKSLSLLFGVLTLAMLFALALEFFRDRSDRKTIAALAVLALASSAPFTAWSVGGLETTLCAFLFTLAALLLLKSDRATSNSRTGIVGPVVAGVVMALSLLTRPEAMLHVALIVAFLALLLRWCVASVAAFILPIAIIFGAFLIWRWDTYHALLPNTFTAKTGGAGGGLILGVKYYLAAIASILGPVLLLFPLGFLSYKAIWRKLSILLCFVFATTIFTIYAGGDWMPGARFLIPVAPMLVLIALQGGVAIFDLIRERIVNEKYWRYVAISLCVLVPLSSLFSERVLLRGQLPMIESGFNVRTGHALPDHELTARWIHSNYPNNIVVAAGEAGLIGYLNPQLTLIDCGGLMDTSIAMDRRQGRGFNAGRILAAKPDLVLLYGMNGIDRGSSQAPTVGAYSQAFLSDPNFKTSYREVKRFGEFAIWSRK